jgi:segregation and condensation protein A
MGRNFDSLASSLDEPVHLAAFDGPLDLLLYLVRRSEIDICDIPIASIADQYIAVIERAREDRLEIAGDFLVLAATLMRIKSRMLLPPEARAADTAEENGGDPRWELAKMLLEYNRYKEVAGVLAARIAEAGERVPRLVGEFAQPERQEEAIAPVGRFDVWEAFNAVLRRFADRMTDVAIEPERLNVSECMETIRSILKGQGGFFFSELFPKSGSISRLFVAVNFLATLELARLGAVRLRQGAAFDDFEINAA